MGTTTDPPPARRAPARAGRGWTLLSNHGHVLVCLARDPRMRVRDVAATVGLTERACYRIVSDLVAAGLLRRERVGRSNRYTIELTASAGHPAWRGMSAARLLDIS